MQKYVIVQFINLNNVPNNFRSSEWPLHVTLLANFTLAAPLDELIDNMSDYCKQSSPFEVDVKGEALFGPNSNVTVSLVEPKEAIKQLHYGLADIASSLGAEFDEPNFMREGYRPHVTIQSSARLREGQKVEIGNITLVDMFPNKDINQRQLVQSFELGRK